MSSVAGYSIAGDYTSVSSSRKGWFEVSAGRKCVYSFHRKRKTMDVFSAIDARQFEIASRVLSELPNFCAKDSVKFEPFCDKAFSLLGPSRSCRRKFGCGSGFGDLFSALSERNTDVSAVKYFALSFETE